MSPYETLIFMTPVKRSREISPRKAAFRRSHQHSVSFRHAPSCTPSPLRGPLPLKGTQGFVPINPFVSFSILPILLNWPTSSATPYPASRDFPLFRGQNKASLYFPLSSYVAPCSAPIVPPRRGVAKELESLQRTGFVGEPKRPENPVSR